MLARIVAIIALLPLSFLAQTKIECGNKMSAVELQNHYARVQSIGTLLPHDTCLNRELSIVFHIVLDSSKQTGIVLTDLDVCIDKLNAAWKPICITFKKCSVNYVPDYNYNKWQDIYHEPRFSSNYYVDNTIDIVLVESIELPAGASGYADSLGHIVMLKSVLLGTTPIHEMGHLFGLPHTFEGPAPNALSVELVKRNGCNLTGDGFCDTEADPHPTGEVPGAHCDFQAGPKDANNDYYTPPLDNYMTYFKPCRCRFTQEQYNYMAWVFLIGGGTLH